MVSRKIHLFFWLMLSISISFPANADWIKVGESVKGDNFYLEFGRIRKHDGYYSSKTYVQGNPKQFRLERTFKNYGTLARKQIQLSLKKRWYYKSNIDGLWVTDTKNALVRFAQDKGLDAFYPREVYDEVSRGLNVPRSFAVAKKQPKASQNSGSGSNALGTLFLLGALCSMTPDAVACISGKRW